MADLRAKSGAAFDQAYAAHDIMYHQTSDRQRDADRSCGGSECGTQIVSAELRAGVPDYLQGVRKNLARRSWQLIHGGGP